MEPCTFEWYMNLATTDMKSAFAKLIGAAGEVPDRKSAQTLLDIAQTMQILMWQTKDLQKSYNEATNERQNDEPIRE